MVTTLIGDENDLACGRGGAWAGASPGAHALDEG